jgi:hypothetical protein
LIRPQKKDGFYLAGKLFLWEYGNMKTTLEIPNPLFKRVKAQAAMEGLKLKDVVTSALSAYLTRPRPPSKREAKPCPFPLVRGKVGALMKQMNNETIAELQEKEDLERHRRSFGR